MNQVANCFCKYVFFMDNYLNTLHLILKTDIGSTDYPYKHILLLKFTFYLPIIDKEDENNKITTKGLVPG